MNRCMNRNRWRCGSELVLLLRNVPLVPKPVLPGVEVSASWQVSLALYHVEIAEERCKLQVKLSY